MIRRILCICAALVTVGSTPVKADTLPQVTLTLMPPTTLPGLPVAFVITITNLSSQDAVIADGASLKVVTAAATFNAVGLRGSTIVPLPHDQLQKCGEGYCLTIAANRSRQVYVTFGPLLVQNEFFVDRRLSTPGRYDLEITLFLLKRGTTNVTEIHSEPQTLLIQQPTGADLDVWNFLQETSSGDGWSASDWIDSGDHAATWIREAKPSSVYAAWVGAIGPTTQRSFQSKLAQMDVALAANPPDVMRDEILLEKGALLRSWSDDAIANERDAEKAVKLTDQARMVFRQLRSVAVTDYIRHRSEEALGKLLTGATANDDLRFFEQHDPPAPEKIIPRVECVFGEGPDFGARFGYRNPNKTFKVLSIGALNQVTPAPRDQGQPRVFKPGDHDHVFTATSRGGNLTWHLDGSIATATSDFAVRCPSTPVP